MAGNGNRVWFARLIIAACASIVGVSIVLAIVWHQLTSAGSDTDNRTTTVFTPPTVSDSGAPTGSHGSAKQHALDPVLELAREALVQHRKRDTDYTAIMIKRERIGGKLLPQSKMELKLRYSPAKSESTQSKSSVENDSDKAVADESKKEVDSTAKNDAEEARHVSVYLKFIEPKNQAGREAIWVQDANDGSLIVHETGMLNLLRAKLAPNSTLAMLGNKYPVTEIGLEKLLTKLIERGERDKQYGPCEVAFHENVMLGERNCKLIEVKHPAPTEKVNGVEVKFEFHLAQIYIDKELMLPIRYACYLWPTADSDELPLEEEYTYEDIHLNVGLTESDFDPDNKQYNYP